MKFAFNILLLFFALPSVVAALGSIAQPRYFDLSFPMSEGLSTDLHPWTLNFGHVSPLKAAQQPGDDFAALRLEPTEPNAQLTFDSISASNSWVFVSTRVTLSPSEGNSEFFDFCGALVSFRDTEEGGRLGFLSRAPESGEWTWFELDQAVGQNIENSGSTTLNLQFAIHRATGRWALGVDDLAFPNLDLIPALETGQPESSLYILGLHTHALTINDIRIVEIHESALQAILNDRQLRKLIPEDTKFFIQEGVIKVKQFTAENPHERLRILYLRGSRINILDQDQKPMKQIDGGELLSIVVYGSAGPTPSFLEAIIDAEYTDPSDLKYIKWELYASDELDKNFTLFREGRLDQGISGIIIPLREGGNDPPLGLSIRIFLDL